MSSLEIRLELWESFLMIPMPSSTNESSFSKSFVTREILLKMSEVERLNKNKNVNISKTELPFWLK